MSTAVKPLAPHGTTARAKGRPAAGIKGCPCRLCRDAENAYNKRRRYLNETGRTLMVDAGPVQQHLVDLFADGAGWTQLGAATSCSSSTLVAILRGERPEITRRVASSILAVKAADVLPPNRAVPATGSIRRCRAIIAAGHRLRDIADTSPLDPATVRYIISGQPETISARTAEGAAIAYKALAGRRGNSTRSLNRASREAWAPPGAWDDDRIDDPAATPDWTGYCGSDRGYWVHRRQQLPMCPRCEAAHEKWIAEHAGLDPQLRNQALFRARNSAVSREADLAADAREVMKFGANADQAAERLGVTRQHLQQALIRHPEIDETPAEQDAAVDAELAA